MERVLRINIDAIESFADLLKKMEAAFGVPFHATSRYDAHNAAIGKKDPYEIHFIDKEDKEADFMSDEFFLLRVIADLKELSDAAFEHVEKFAITALEKAGINWKDASWGGDVNEPVRQIYP